jgi:hypothetical protein
VVGHGGELERLLVGLERRVQAALGPLDQAEARARLPEDAARRAWDEGRAMSAESALALAVALLAG